MKVSRELWVALGTVVLVAAIAYVSRRTPAPGPPVHKQGNPFEILRADFLGHRISAEALCEGAQPPSVIEAMKRPGKRVPASFPLSGIVTLQGQTDHSGTEVAAVMYYDCQLVGSVIVSPFCVRTDPKGRFDFSALALEAWEWAPAGKATGPGAAPEPAASPMACLLVRHRGYDSRVAPVNVWGLLKGTLPSKGAATWHVGGIELLPEGTTLPCLKAFGSLYNPASHQIWFDEGRCRPWHVREHLEKHPECRMADDALYHFLALNFDIPRPGVKREEVAEGFKLFRDRSMAGRDNTGLSLFYQPGVSPDGSWGELLQELETQFRPK